MAAAYPSSILSWTQRVNSQTVWAADPNALAAEIDAIEQYVGVNPQIESSSLAGGTTTFSSMSARLSDAMLQRGHPYIAISRTTNWDVLYSSSSTHVFKNPFGTTNSDWSNYVQPGGSVIIRDAGVWLINAVSRWQYATSGWVMMELWSNGATLRRSIFSYNQFPRGGSNTYGEVFTNMDGFTECTFVGRLPAGTNISVVSGNYSILNPIQVQGQNLDMYWLRP